MRKATAVLLSLFMIFSLTLTACAAEETTEISAAPEIVNDLTYVPAEFFAEVTESATVDGTSLVVTAE